MHVSKGVQLADGLIGVDSPDKNHSEYKNFMNFKKNAVILDKYSNCMTEGLTLGRSTAFITAVMCEMLRAYTVKSTRPATETFRGNPYMHIACLVSFLATVSLTIIPGVKEIFKLDTPAWFYYFISFVFAFGCML